MKVAQLCPTLCSPMDYSLPSSSPWNSPGKNTGVGRHSLLQGIFPIRGLNPGLLHCRQILYCLSHQGSPIATEMLFTQSCPALCDPVDCSPPDSSTHGIFQARVLEWVAIAFSIWRLGLQYRNSGRHNSAHNFRSYTSQFPVSQKSFRMVNIM